jgi:7-cyano-7-deazaguanine synthase
MTRNIVILSGGLDSTAALGVTLQEHHPIATVAISFDYGQRHRRELDSAAAVCLHYGIEHRIIDLRGLLQGSALLGAGAVPEGHYAAETMAATVVQGRNLLFTSVAIAACQPGDHLTVGVHAGDHPIYADCRPGFWHHLAEVATAYGVHVQAPFVELEKSDVVVRGYEAEAPLELTWSCYTGGKEHCGRCGTCVERAEAFSLAGIPDPTIYQDPNFWREATA